MSDREIVNSTVYRTSDIVSIIDEGLKIGATGWRSPTITSDIKIRYINKPHITEAKYNRLTKVYDQGEIRYVKCPSTGWGNIRIEIGLVRPAKIKVSALQLLAEATVGCSDEMLAPTVLKNHLVEALAERLGITKKVYLDACENLTVRQDDKAKDRKAYTLMNLKKRVQSKKDAIEHATWEITRQQASLDWSKKRLAELKKELPALEEKVKNFK